MVVPLPLAQKKQCIILLHATNPTQPRQTINNNPPPHTTNNPNKNATDRHHTSERMTTRKKKKLELEPDLAKGAEQDERVEVGELVQDEETQGESQTLKGVWVSPAPEREREREKERTTASANIPNNQRKREDKQTSWLTRVRS